MNEQMATVAHYLRRAVSVQRRMGQDLAVGRQPSKDDTARYLRYVALSEAVTRPLGAPGRQEILPGDGYVIGGVYV